MSQRLLRVQELLKREIGEIIRREVPMEVAGLVSINGLEVSSDLHTANVYISIIGSDEQKRAGLALLLKERKRFQGMIAKNVILKYTPKLRFFSDDSIDRGNRVLEILNEIEDVAPQPEEE